MTFPDLLNRRNSLRHHASLAIVAQPVDARRNPIDEPILAVTLDLSQSGVSFFADRPLLSELALIEIQAAELNYQLAVLGKRIRCQRRGPYFEIAVQFTEKIALSTE